MSPGQKEKTLDSLNSLVVNSFSRGQYEEMDRLSRQIEKVMDGRIAVYDRSSCTSVYLLGFCKLRKSDSRISLDYFSNALAFKEHSGIYDREYFRILYNLSIAYSRLGNFPAQMEVIETALNRQLKIYGEDSPELVSTILSLTSAAIAQKDYSKALEYSNIALKIAAEKPDSVAPADLVTFYSNLGVMYHVTANYSKAVLYYEKAESVYRNSGIVKDENYYALLINLGYAYSDLGQYKKSEEYYNMGGRAALRDTSAGSISSINIYAVSRQRRGETQKGAAILDLAMKKVKTRYGSNSGRYFTALFYYAEYLRDFVKKPGEALKYFELCLKYAGENHGDFVLSEEMYLGYANALIDTHQYEKALVTLENMLKGRDGAGRPEGEQENKTLAPDKASLKILKLKYEILLKLYQETSDLSALANAVVTSAKIVGVLEKVRINISEEDSRLILGDRFRSVYLNAIRDLELLYRQTGKEEYLEQAFEFAEKSKVAGLLAATRELNASQFSIPQDLSALEKMLQHDIGISTEKLNAEIRAVHPDTSVINYWKEIIFEKTAKRDSLVSVFEKKYRGYYTLKYNTRVAKPEDIPGMAGRSANYLSFISSDTLLYIFVVNRENLKLLTIRTDSSFFADLKHFRSLLSMPSPSGDARAAFNDFQQTGYRLYKQIIEPAKPYLLSGQLLVSPDNMLSYIPLETLPSGICDSKGLLYSKIKYLMNDYEISYTYSATFLAESRRRSESFGNRLVAFAPGYSEPINAQSVLQSRQLVNGMLPDLPYARQEAEYVASLTGGRLFKDSDASESAYKEESAKYDIIHLAMHTVLNDQDPMYSTLIFSQGRDSADDRYLKTYEVYSIPLRAKMVVLSSCNSGSGLLNSGEGILSLARGFMYSGSKSVVMAMWEIEDRSGTEIVKRFYNNLKKGYSKSTALRMARMEYLRNADQLRAHPYFWSSLVVYGNNCPIYISHYLRRGSCLLAALAAVVAVIYFWRRRYS